MKRNFRTRLLSFLVALAVVCSLTTGMSVTVVAADQDIVILYTNDVHCGVDENIGYAGLSLYKKQMLAQTPYVALVDAGDSIQGAPIGTLSDGGYLTDIMNQVGYDFAIPGNHEFDYGMPRFLELAGKLNCGYYSCNFLNLTTGQPVFAPFKLMDFGGTTVAFVGVSTPESFTKSTPTYFQDGNGNYIYSFCEDETGARLYAQVQASVDAARASGALFVILVGHLGENGSTPRWTSDSVIANTNGINAAIDGHSHEAIANKMVKNKDGVEIPLTQSGTKLASIGKMTIHPDLTITTELVSSVSVVSASQGTYTVETGDSLARIAKKELGSFNRWKDIYDVNNALIKDPNLIYRGMQLTLPDAGYINAEGKAADYSTDQFVKKIQAQYNASLETVLGTTEVELTIKNPATGERAVRNGETNLGDLAADAYRNVLGADIGIVNGGGCRANIAAGNITFNDALTVFPYGNMGCVVQVSGKVIKDALEMASRNYPAENGGFLQVSGLTYTINSSIPSSVQTDDKGNFTGVSGEYRVSDIMVGGVPLDENALYTVASHNYMLKSGGDGMTMFAGGTILKDEVMTDVDILTAYISKNLGGKVGAEYANPLGEGRITFK